VVSGVTVTVCGESEFLSKFSWPRAVAVATVARIAAATVAASAENAP
jgi:hypothetical protein